MSRPRKIRILRPRAKDLFGQVPVTLADLQLWVKTTAPHMLDTRWRFENYVKCWNIAGKVRASKIDGSFWTLIEKN